MAPKTYSVILINNFLGNTWRPVMMQTAAVMATVPPLESRISSVRLVASDNNAASENTAINSAILQHPDILLIDAANSTASNQVIQRACSAGITVVSFDVLVTAPCAWKIAVDFAAMGKGQAAWLANTIHGKGTILEDLGQPGQISSSSWQKAADSVLKKFPNIKVATYYGNYSPGSEQAGVAALIPSLPKIDGILGYAYGNYANAAMTKAGRKPVPVTGFAYNVALLSCLKLKVPCLYYSSPTWISGSAMRLAIQVKDGVLKGSPRTITLNPGWFANTKTKFPTSGGKVFSIAKTALPKVSGGLMMPLSPDWAKVNATDVLKKPQVG